MEVRLSEHERRLLEKISALEKHITNGTSASPLKQPKIEQPQAGEFNTFHLAYSFKQLEEIPS